MKAPNSTPSSPRPVPTQGGIGTQHSPRSEVGMPAASAPSPGISLHIDHLVVRGVEVRDPGAFQLALEHELASLAAADPSALEGLDARARHGIEIPSEGRGLDSRRLGRAVARALLRRSE